MTAVLRWLGALLLLASGILGVSFVQKKFDEGDTKKALGAVRAKFPEVRDCQARVVSRFQGQIQVRCEKQSWMVDVVQGIIMKGEK